MKPSWFSEKINKTDKTWTSPRKGGLNVMKEESLQPISNGSERSLRIIIGKQIG